MIPIQQYVTLDDEGLAEKKEEKKSRVVHTHTHPDCPFK